MYSMNPRFNPNPQHAARNCITENHVTCISYIYYDPQIKEGHLKSKYPSSSFSALSHKRDYDSNKEQGYFVRKQ